MVENTNLAILPSNSENKQKNQETNSKINEISNNTNVEIKVNNETNPVSISTYENTNLKEKFFQLKGIFI
jgi:hypothetical protein